MVDTEHALHTFMAQVTSEMASEYDRLFARSSEDPGTAGDEGEENWASLLRDWLPPQYHITTKGRLINSRGEMSPQIDVLVLKPFYPNKLREKKVWLADGVAAIFECKTTLKSKHVADSADRCREFKALIDRDTGSPKRELISPLIYGILAHSHSWKSKTSKPIEIVTRAVDKAMVGADHPIDTIDLVCVSDLGCWSSTSMPFYSSDWVPDDRDELRKVFDGEWGPVTGMTCAAIGGERQSSHFRPIGAALAFITQRLAWQDIGLRDLAKYYMKADLVGSSAGRMHFWPQSTFSAAVRSKIEARSDLRNGERWNEWGMVLS